MNFPLSTQKPAGQSRRKLFRASLSRILPRGLMGRSLLILVTPVFLVQVLTAFFFFDNHWNRMTGRLAYAVAGEIASIVDALEDERLPQARIMEIMENHLELHTFFAPGEALGSMGERGKGYPVWNSLVTRTLARELAAMVQQPFALSIDLKEKKIHVAVQLEEGVLHVFLPGRRLFSSSSYIFLLWMTGSSLLLLGIAILFMRNQIRPIRKLAVAAERFGRGRDVPFFKPSGAREVRQAAQAFLDMHRRIKRHVEQRTAMLAGVSHDLRTPLTRLKLHLAVMGDGQDIRDMSEDIRDMERMIEGYLDFVRGDGDEEFSPVSLPDLVRKVAGKTVPEDIEITLDVPEILVSLRPVAFERCLVNIIGNAVAYANRIVVRAETDEHFLSLIVDDNGPGIPPEQYEDVFRPFIRLDPSRNTETGGVGLGLPTALDIVYGHGGKMELDLSPLGGLRVRITIPLS